MAAADELREHELDAIHERGPQRRMTATDLVNRNKEWAAGHGLVHPLTFTSADTGVIRQTRLESLLEATVNVTTGFVISWLVWVFIAAPLMGVPFSAFDSLGLTALFTVTSMARSYIWRRFFNASIHKRIHQWLAS